MGNLLQNHHTRLVVSDLDGTLLGSDLSISEYTKRMIAQCRAAGIQFAFATARSERAAKPYIDAICPDGVAYWLEQILLRDRM